MRIVKLTLALMLATTTFVSVGAQSPEADLQRAIQREETTGDLRAAIAEYQRIADAAAASNASIAGQALLRQAQLFEKLGDSGAARAVRERARGLISSQAARGDAGGKQTSPAVSASARRGRTLGITDPSGTVSKDGRYLSFIGSGGNLSIADLRTDHVRPLTDRGDYSLHLSAVSPNGGMVAYGTFNGCAPGGRPAPALCLVSTNGAGIPTPRQLFASDDVSEVRPMDWSSDGLFVAVSLRRSDRTAQVGVVRVADGRLDVIQTVDWRGPTRVFFSPDGRDLAFDLPTGDQHDRRDVFVRSVDGSRGSTVVESSAQDVVMGWTHTGHLLFASDRTSSMGLWAVEMSAGRAIGNPKLIQAGIATAWSLGVTTDGALYLGVRASERDVALRSFDVVGLKPAGAPERVVEQHVGTTLMPEWSADGRQLAFVSGRGFNPTNNEGRIIGIRTLATGATRELYPQLLYFGAISWSPDGRTFLTAGTDLKGRDGVFAVDAETAAVSPVADGPITAMPRWSRDGTSVYYRRVSERGAGNWAIVERRMNSGVERILAEGGYGAFSVSPDGRSIVATSGVVQSGVATSIVLIDVQRGGARELLRAGADQAFMTFTGLPWTPDGSAVLVRLQRPRELWHVPVSGEAPQRLDIDVTGWQAGPAGQFSLSPDGTRVAFTSGTVRDEIRMLERVLP
jgi:Tol biopolymer transport system component